MNRYLEQIEQINTAYSKTSAAYGRWAKTQGLNYNSLLMLCILEEKGTCTQKMICEELLLPKSTVHSILLDFMKKGYMALEAAPDNKKEKVVVLTDAGKVFSDEILTKLHKMEVRAMERLGPRLSAQLVHTTVLYYEYFQEETDLNHE